MRNKRAGVTEFTLNETLAIRDKFFSDMTLEYLFERNEDSEKKVG